MLQHTATHCNTHCSTLQKILRNVLDTSTLKHTAAPWTRRSTLQHTALPCNILQHPVTHCSTLQHALNHCNVLQHHAAHCSTLHYTTTCCKTLQDTARYCSNMQCTVGLFYRSLCILEGLFSIWRAYVFALSISWYRFQIIPLILACLIAPSQVSDLVTPSYPKASTSEIAYRPHWHPLADPLLTSPRHTTQPHRQEGCECWRFLESQGRKGR